MKHEKGKAVYLVRGDDEVLVAQAVRELTASLVGDEDAALVTEDMDAEEVDVGAVVDACRTPPFLTARRVVVLRRSGTLTAGDAARLVDYLNEPLDTTALVLVGGGGTVPAALVKAVRHGGQVVDAGRPVGKAGDAWLAERLRRAPVRFESDARQMLAEHLGEDVGRLEGVLDVLAASYGEGARVGTEQLTPLLGEAGAVPPWALTDAIDKGKFLLALERLHRMLDAGERHPLVVLAILHRHYASMLRLDGAGVTTDSEAAALLGTKPFPARKVLAGARALGPQKLRRAILLLGGADLDLRGESAWPDRLVLEVLVARLCQLAPAVGTGRR